MQHGYWHEQRVDLLKKLWGDGLSASQIANELGGKDVTRNSVIGKVHRLGLSGRERRVSARPVVLEKRIPRKRDPHPNFSPVPIDPTPLPDLDIFDSIIPVGQRRTLMELDEETCRWPVGDPCTPEFFFCGGKPLTGLPYCSYHSRVAYEPPNGRKPRPWLSEVEGRA